MRDYEAKHTHAAIERRMRLPKGVISIENVPVIDLTNPRDRQGRPISEEAALRQQIVRDNRDVAVLCMGTPLRYPNLRLADGEREELLASLQPAIDSFLQEFGPKVPTSVGPQIVTKET